jgi:preprotein translocase subunit SecA
MFKKIAQLFTGDPHKRKIEQMVKVVDQVNALESQFEQLSDAQLSSKTDEFRSRLAKNESLDDLLPEAFAVVREASKRVLGQRHYDTQIICGINLHQGSISELRTGEGKTLSATMPLYLNALSGKGAHLVTVNDYLARWQGRWMGQLFRMLGMSVGILQMAESSSEGERAYIYDPNVHNIREDLDQLRPVHRREAYKADITYGTNSEFGFDYLRDNITMRWEDRAQRPHNFAIIDEVDSILIDEARTPLIISGPSHEDSENYVRMAQVARALNPEDYEVDEKDRAISLTEIGKAHVEELLGQPLSDPERPEDITPEQARIFGFLEQSLRAQYLFHRNKEYIVQGGEVVIVDEFTGRMMPGRRWSDGLHQAIEAKEGVKVQAENITHATITIQNYFRMYKKLAGMTGTALTEQEEFFRIYGLDVLAIPTNLEYRAMRADGGLIALEDKDEEGYRYTYYADPEDPQKTPLFYKRKDYPDVIYRTGEGKLRAIVREIMRFHAIGRPQLIGTTSVEKSELLSERLAPDMVRRLVQVLLLRQAWLAYKGMEEEDYSHAPELEQTNAPLDQLRMPDLRKLGKSLGLSSIDPKDESNRSLVLEAIGLDESYWPRLEPLFDGGVPHQVLNARKHTEESQIIAGAGAYGAVTIATNMAGRGVDIKLGGELPEAILAQVNQVLVAAGAPDPYNMNMQQRLEFVENLPLPEDDSHLHAIESFKEYMANMAHVRELGGLHVIGSERHEARRIDNQLRGRAGRQGDPGSSRFYLALDDDLMRLFGGGQMEGVLQRFNFDESFPIEVALISRVIESSQTRVEGANFDVRKHLLEYDDVLNAQRNRIYEQRDKIFQKDDLHEDVREMLHIELGPRIHNGLQDKEGPWKLLAWLEDLQPTINTPWVDYPSYTYRLALEELGQPQTVEALGLKLAEMARNSVQTENEHLLMGVANLLDRGDEALRTQLIERSDALDAYLETFDPSEEHDLNNEISQLVQMSIRLTNAEQRQLLDDPISMKEALKEILRQGLTLNFARRALLTLERRFNETWQLKAQDLADKPWKEVKETILGQVQNTLDRREERLFGENGEIARDLEANVELLQEGLESEKIRLRVLQLLTQGQIIAFDARSHRRIFKQVDRFNYLFSMAKKLSGENADVLSKRVESHLHGAEDAFVSIFGNADFEHMQKNGFKLAALQPDTITDLKTEFGEEYSQLAEEPLDEISEENKQRIVPILGNRAQNRLYRQLLLRTITERWVEYLTRMEALRVSISMESYAQRDPLVQYKSQASSMFSELLSEVRQTVLSMIFRYRPGGMEEEKKAAIEVAASGLDNQNQSQAGKNSGQTKRRSGRKRHKRR